MPQLPDIKKEEDSPVQQKSRPEGWDCGSRLYGTTDRFSGGAGSSVLEASEIEFFLPFSYE